MHYRIGTRGSKLALAQTEYVKSELQAAYPGDTFEIVIVVTRGDRVLDKPLAEIGSKGVFVQEIEERLLAGGLDMAVHSMKDMPGELTPGLAFSKAWKREDPRDALILREASSLEELSHGAVIGTGSLRRQLQCKALRSDLQFVNIRGNVDSRLRKMEEQKLDGIILASAGLKRLGMECRINHLFGPEEMVSAPAQGILAIQLRAEDEALREKLDALADDTADLQARAERTWLAMTHATCHMPVGAYCQVDSGHHLTLHTVYGQDGNGPVYHIRTDGSEPEQVAEDAIRILQAKLDAASRSQRRLES